jgi:hypothetical protein
MMTLRMTRQLRNGAVKKRDCFGDAEIQLPGSRLVFCLPDSSTGRFVSDGVFKIFSEDRKLSCFLFQHGGAEPLPPDWVSAEFALAGETLRPMGVLKRAQNDTVFRYLEGPSVVACKFAKTNRSGAGLHGSAAARKEDAERLRTFVKLFLGSLRRRKSTPPPPQSRPVTPPTPPPAPIVTRDQRLRGLWHCSSPITSGSDSMTSFRFRYFAGDGRFAQGGESYATFVQTGSSGKWAGMNVLHSRVPPDERGTWETARGILTLNYEDNMCSEFSYCVQGNDLLLQQPGRDNQFWTRG